MDIFRRLGFKYGVSSKLADLSIIEFNSGNYETARRCLIEGLEICIEIGDDIDFRINFDIAAALLVETSDFEKAARLAGVAAARTEDLAYFYEPVEQRFRDTYLAKLKSVMPEGEFNAAFSEGRKMLRAEATELALEAARQSGESSRRLHLVRG